MSPKISVLIVNYNYGSFIYEAISSAINQSLPRSDYEVVIVDDGSTDNSMDKIKSFSEKIILIKTEHSGLPIACNKGSEKCSGKYVIRLDSDDKLDRFALEKHLLAMNNNQCDFTVSDRLEIFPDGTKKIFKVDPYNIYTYLSVGILFNKEYLNKVSGYRQFFWEEHDLMVRYKSLFNKVIYIPEPLYIYRRHGSSMSDDVSNRVNGWRVLIDEWGADKLKGFGSNKELDEDIDKFY